MDTPSPAFDGDVETGKNRRDRHCAAFRAKSDTRGREARYSSSVAEETVKCMFMHLVAFAPVSAH